MSGRFIFLLGQTPRDAIGWAKLTGRSPISSGRLDSADELSLLAKDIAEADRVIAILPGEQLAVRAMAAPPQNAAKLKAAMDYLLDDELGEAVQELHIVAAMIGGERVALAVKKSLVRNWLSVFQNAEIALDFMTADFLCLPATEGKAAIFFDEDRIVASIGSQGFSASNGLAMHLLPPLLENSAKPVVEVFGIFNEVAAASGLAPEDVCPLDSEEVFAQYALGLDGRASPNFLSGEFKDKKSWRDGALVWRRAATMTVAVAAFSLALFVAQGVRDMNIAKTYEQRATALHEQYFPQAQGGDIRAHAVEILSRSSDISFLRLSAVFNDALGETSEVQVDRLRYDAMRGQLVASLKSADDSNIEALQITLLSRGVRAEDAGGYRRSGNLWVGDMTVSAQ
ncbi:MAG: hypothetical protein GXP06_11145 [Alphaproteobacteria bacterium]|nr:hypothetical protein [Alphaproteobacteria bacterium]